MSDRRGDGARAHPTIVVVGSGTDVGKTWVACRLVEHLVAAGVDVEVRKPVLSGWERFEGSDTALLMAAARGPAASAASAKGADERALDVVTPFRFRAPIAPDAAARVEGRALSLDDVVAACAPTRAGSAVVVEMAGGVMSPLCEDATVLDAVARLAAPALLVVGGYLGAISHGLTAHVALQSRGVAVEAVVVNRGDAAPFRRWLPGTRVVDDVVALAAPLAARARAGAR